MVVVRLGVQGGIFVGGIVVLISFVCFQEILAAKYQKVWSSSNSGRGYITDGCIVADVVHNQHSRRVIGRYCYLKLKMRDMRHLEGANSKRLLKFRYLQRDLARHDW